MRFTQKQMTESKKKGITKLENKVTYLCKKLGITCMLNDCLILGINNEIA